MTSQMVALAPFEMATSIEDPMSFFLENIDSILGLHELFLIPGVGIF